MIDISLNEMEGILSVMSEKTSAFEQAFVNRSSPDTDPKSFMKRIRKILVQQDLSRSVMNRKVVVTNVKMS